MAPKHREQAETGAPAHRYSQWLGTEAQTVTTPNVKIVWANILKLAVDTKIDGNVEV